MNYVHLGDSFLVNNQFITVLALALSFVLSACVTQSFEDGETPVVQNQANREDMAVTRISLGLGYLKMGNMPQAKQNLEKAKKFAPDMVQVYTAFAHYYETVGEDKLTIASYEKALSIESEDADTLNNYGVYLCRQDQIDAAEEHLLKAIAVPSYILVSKSYENLASCFLQKDNFDKAKNYLNKAIMHSPSSASTVFQMVRLQYAMGDYQQAKAFAQRFEKVTRRFTPQSLALAFKVYFKLGQRRTAKNYAAMLVKMYPQSWEAQQYLLNELELIDADNLAKRYQLTQVHEHSNKPKKRVVKLSPKKASPRQTSAKKISQQKELSHQSSTSPVLVSEIPAKQIATPSKPVTLAAANTLASTQSINAALSMAPVTEQLATENDVTVLAAPMAKPLANSGHVIIANASEKRVVVLSAPNKATSNTTNDSEEVAVAKIDKNEIFTSVKVDTDAAQKIIPQEDREFFHVAKKPEAIVEDPVEIITGLIVVKAATKAVTNESEKAAEAVNTKEPVVHIVTKGDTLYSISVKYNVKIKALRRWNQLSTKKKIRINDKLFVENPTAVIKVNG
ncbi:type IV pilus biogenesis/stability protein PilW [Colwellia sp. 39_35_sub15_T18]|nr:type IV pilus biogenesis/stability protein PilW [Colwellia sp. 39_35_sub15_T18]